MAPERHRALASRGGKTAHARHRAHEFSTEEARRAGQRGGAQISKNREHMAAIGRKGGLAKRSRPATAQTLQASTQTPLANAQTLPASAQTPLACMQTPAASAQTPPYGALAPAGSESASVLCGSASSGVSLDTEPTR